MLGCEPLDDCAPAAESQQRIHDVEEKPEPFHVAAQTSGQQLWPAEESPPLVPVGDAILASFHTTGSHALVQTAVDSTSPCQSSLN